MGGDWAAKSQKMGQSDARDGEEEVNKHYTTWCHNTEDHILNSNNYSPRYFSLISLL
jgi:hypothetical protein